MNTVFCRVSTGVLALLAALSLPACKSVEVPKIPGVTPYRMVIQQGNFISQEMVAQLKPGMTREQVRFVLGTPLVSDIFHADRWDYVFFRELPDGKKEQRNLSVIFEKDRLARVLGDLMPAQGAAPQATGFEPLAKPEARPEAKPVAKPAAEAPKPVAEAPKPVPVAPQPAAEPAKAVVEPAKPAAAPVAKAEDKPAQEPKARGFFGRMLEKIGL